jgi:hypothetical protein
MAKANQATWMDSIQYFSDNPSRLDAKRYQNFANFMLKNHLIKQAVSIQRYQGH